MKLPLKSTQGKAEGGHYPYCNSQSNDGKKWVAMPWTIVGGMIAYRKSWFAEVGYERSGVFFA